MSRDKIWIESNRVVLFILLNILLFLFNFSNSVLIAQSAHSEKPKKTPSIDSDADIDKILPQITNWGKWGETDQLGTVNYITPEKVLEAKGLIRTGETISLARMTSILETPDVREGNYRLYRHEYGSRDYVGAMWHGFAVTHIDALCHVFADTSRMYNGYSNKLFDEKGAQRLGVEVLAERAISGRGVLLDIAEVKGRLLEPGTAIFPEDLEEAEKKLNVNVQSGDILFIRTGAGSLNTREQRAGLHPSSLLWIHSREVALLGSDGDNDAHPINFDRWASPFHTVGIPYMGLPLIDNAELSELSIKCKEQNRWEFFITIAPWKLKGVSSSPINPIAIF